MIFLAVIVVSVSSRSSGEVYPQLTSDQLTQCAKDGPDVTKLVTLNEGVCKQIDYKGFNYFLSYICNLTPQQLTQFQLQPPGKDQFSFMLLEHYNCSYEGVMRSAGTSDLKFGATHICNGFRPIGAPEELIVRLKCNDASVATASLLLVITSLLLL